MTDVLQGVPSLFEICWEGICVFILHFIKWRHQLTKGPPGTRVAHQKHIIKLMKGNVYYVTLIVVTPSLMG